MDLEATVAALIKATSTQHPTTLEHFVNLLMLFSTHQLKPRNLAVTSPSAKT
jgi:hypothetical protein